MSPKEIRLSGARHHLEIYFLVIPSLLLILAFQYYPAASGIWHSFYRWNGNDIADWIAWSNYLDILFQPDFWASFRVALIIGLWNVVKMVPPLLVAVCIHRCRSLRSQFVYRSLFVIPMVLPGLIVAFIWRQFFFEATTGYLNQFLQVTGMMNCLQWLDAALEWGGIFAPGKQPAWLGDPRLILTAVVIWGFPWVGSFAVLTHLAKLQSIPKEIYEAAEVDGIGWFSRFLHIELPMIAGSIYLLLVFLIIDTLKDAGMIIALAGIEGGPGGTVTVPALFMLRKAFIDQELGYACAVGIVLTLIVLSLQKLSAIFLHWSELRAWQRFSFKVTLLGVSSVMYWLDFFRPLLLLVVALILPWPWLAETCRRIALKVTSVLGAGRQKAQTQWQYTSRASSPSLWRTAGGSILRASKHLTICVVLAFSMVPLYLMLIVSGKTNEQFYDNPAGVTLPFHWENWSSAWKIIVPTLANSMFVATTATVLTLFFALGAAYFFARLRMPGSTLLWNAVLILMMLPSIANLVPLFTLLANLNLLNALSALVIVGTSSGLVFAIFVLRNFIQDLPHDLFEAAEIDGAGHFRQMLTVVVPLSGPILGTVGVMRFLAEWNDFVLPLIVISDPEKLPVMVALHRLSGEYVKFWGPLMAGYALASIPIILLFIFSMKLFIRGLTDGAVKA